MGNDLSSDFLKALERLVDGKPRSHELSGKAIRISLAAVAIEAGHARNNLYLPEYRNVRDAVRIAQAKARRIGKHRVAPLRSRDDVVSALRDEVVLLRRKVADLGTENLSLFHRVILAEGRAERLQEKLRHNTVELANRRKKG